jgi:PAS domain S-box-containing protein
MQNDINKITRKLNKIQSFDDFQNAREEFLEFMQSLSENNRQLEKHLEETKGEIAHLNYCINETNKDLAQSLDFADDRSKELFTLLFTIPNQVYFKDEKLQFVRVNHAFETWLNITNEEIKGKADYDVYPEFVRREIGRYERDVLESNLGIFNLEEKIDIDDKEVWLLTSILPYKNANGDTEGIIVSSQDITDRKKYEIHLKRANDLAKKSLNIKNEFLANISHELRTPLHGIIGSSEMLKQMKLDQDSLQLVQIIEQSGKTLLTQVDDILFFSKKEMSNHKLQQLLFNPKELIDELLVKYRPLLQAKGVELRSFMDHDIPNIVQGDMLKLEQIIDIMLSNAMKFTEKGFVHLVSKLISKEHDQVKIEFGIIDTGIGIKKSFQPNIFKPFSAADMSLEKKYTGSGLGLSKAKQILDLLHSSYGFESEYHKGSKFWFILSFQLNNSEEAEQLPVAHAQDIPVLLVEDNLVNQKIAFFTLKKMGFQVDIAENGQEAVDKFSKTEYGLVLMDIQMPIMNGFDATEKIRTIEKKENRTPSLIIALSANVLASDIQRCFEVGMNEFVSKPFSLTKLKEKIRNYYNLG